MSSGAVKGDMRVTIVLACTAALLSGQGPATSRASSGPLALHPDNPHYFLWRGKPTVLITSGEHYGALLNLDFDYRKYIDTLAADGMMLTRVFSGAYVEPEGAFNIARNTLAAQPGRFISPWARSDQPGYANGGNRFDLTRWDEAYFNRLKDLAAYAWQKGIVIEQKVIPGANHFFDGKVEPLMQSVSAYLDKRLKGDRRD